jgi:hypothetical protein
MYKQRKCEYIFISLSRDNPSHRIIKAIPGPRSLLVLCVLDSFLCDFGNDCISQGTN